MFLTHSHCTDVYFLIERKNTFTLKKSSMDIKNRDGDDGATEIDDDTDIDNAAEAAASVGDDDDADDSPSSPEDMKSPSSWNLIFPAPALVLSLVLLWRPQPLLSPLTGAAGESGAPSPH